MTGAPSPATSPLLHVTSLERRFGAARVLRGISLSVNPGECHLIVGPNGAGKSTLLRILAGLARPSGGSVTLGGTVPGREPASRRAIGLLSHQSHLYDDLSAAENLAFAARLYGVRNPERTARDRLATLGLSERADEPVRRLSRGLLQRVAIARALLHDPTLLLLDEPFTGLDPVATSQVTAMLRAELLRGAAVVLVSHEIREAWPLATHAYALSLGRWVLSGPVTGTAEAFMARYREAMDG